MGMVGVLSEADTISNACACGANLMDVSMYFMCDCVTMGARTQYLLIRGRLSAASF